MRIGFYQFCPAFHDVELNLKRVTAALTHARADLVVLPELCLSGYLFSSREELARFAEPVPDGPSCRRLAQVCRDRGLGVVFGLAERHKDKVYNTAVLVTPSGEIRRYRKTHLFLDEKDIFDPGPAPYEVFEAAGAKLGLLVCFDHIFPEAARTLALAGAQVICHPSNLVLDIAQTTTACRCIENRVFWVLANRTGSEKLGDREFRFTGQSQIVAPGGRLLYRAGSDTEELPVIEIDPRAALDKLVTPRNDVLLDRRTDIYW